MLVSRSGSSFFHLSLIAAGLTLLALPSPGVAAAPLSKTAVSVHYAQIPLSFESNQGQGNPGAQFLAHGQGYTLLLSRGNAVLALRKPSASSDPSLAASSNGSLVRLTLIGANPNASAQAQDPQITRTNYFLGNDPSQWRTDVPNYARVQYSGIYSGIGLVYYGNQRRLEHDFLVAPQADPSRIAFAINGATATRIDRKTGDLVLATPSGELRLLKPISYQQINGKRTPVSSAYRLARNKVAFTLGAYDRSKPLVIDPVLAYSTYIDGSDQENAYGVAIDKSGDAFVTGATPSPDFPVTSGAYDTTRLSTNATVFVSKLNPTGSALIYSTYIGGGVANFPAAIAVDAAGHAYITGRGDSRNYPTTASAYQRANNAEFSIFVTKLSAAGNSLIYSTLMGGISGADGQANAIDIDASGNAYITGLIANSNFPTTPGALQTTPGSSFVTKINASGSGLVYSTYLGPTGTTGNAIKVDTSGNVFVAGRTVAGFPTTAGAFQTNYGSNSSNGTNAFVAKINSTGTAFLYSTYLGGLSRFGDVANALAIDSAGDAYVVGSTGSPNFPATPGTLQPTKPTPAITAGFVTKLNPTGTALLYSTFLGGTADQTDFCNAIAIDGSGNAYVAGYTISTGFPVTPAALQTDPGNRFNFDGAVPASNGGFFTKLSPDATTAIYSTYLGGEGNGIAVDSSGSAYIVGDSAENLIPTGNAFQNTSVNFFGDHVFALKLALGSGTPPASGTATTLAANEATPFFGQPVTFTATVAHPGLTAVPTGTVTFNSPDGLVTESVDSSGQASYTTSTLPIGNNIILATYNGDSTYDPSNTQLESIVTLNDSVSITPSNSAVVGQPLTITAAVSPLGSSAIPTGTITFQLQINNVLQPGTVVPLDSTGKASLTLNPPATLSHQLPIFASYSGDSHFDPHPDAELIIGVATPMIGLISTVPQHILYGSGPLPVPLIYKVIANAGPVAGATVNFSGAGLSFSPASAVTAADGTVQTTVTPTAAGQLIAEASVANGGFGSAVDVPLNVGQIHLNVTTPHVFITYGEPIPTFTYSFTGFVNGDTAASITGAPGLTTTATSSSPAGNYPLVMTKGTLASTAYNFGLNNSYIQIHTAPLQLTANSFTIHKGDPLPTLTYTLTGFVNGDTSAVVSGAPVLTTNANSTKPGKYTISIRIGTLTAQNYGFTDVPGTLTVLP